ncbi:MAG: anhydro-N-acetylmuramic acid kinase [Bacteroidetes bacterium]|nr:MAG: anhydro-N-acetylmuramic acid kinase [Bacteroidota bacterium]
MKEYTVVGIMSGTSLDGMDIVLCNFKEINDTWNFKILKAKTYDYDENWKNRLKKSAELSGFELIKLHKEYGKYTGELVNRFLKGIIQKTDLIASHGHTVFHIPEQQLNFQLGDGAIIAATTGINTVNDFRTLDIALNGQGAPLVPIGDYFLFNKYDSCINLGGFANISFENDEKQQIAYDICPINIIANELAQTTGIEYDKGGELGKKGKVNSSLLESMNGLEYYRQLPPKSLGQEWVEEVIKPLIEKSTISINDKIRTVYEHASMQIAESINGNIKESDEAKKSLILFTGGGTHNDFLMDLIKAKSEASIIIPAKEIIDYKEALIFAFLGILRLRREVNCLSSVTGAKADNSGGIIHRVK